MQISDLYSAADSVCDLLTLLLNRHQLMIVCFLVDADKSVRQLATLLDVRESVSSQYLAILRREGQTMVYQIVREGRRQGIGRPQRSLWRTVRLSKLLGKVKHGHANTAED